MSEPAPKKPYFNLAGFKSFVDKELFSVRWFNHSHVAERNAKTLGVPILPVCIITHQGRKSGKWIETPIYYYEDGRNFYLVASKGGWHEDPAWYRNMLANPACKLYRKWWTHKCRARVAVGEERKRLWDKAAALYPPFNEYQEIAAPREIPVMVLERR
jgi:proline iminopeptidase